MVFQFDPEKYNGKAKEKYLAAKQRIERIHHKYPKIRQANELINNLERDYNFLRLGFQNKNGEQEKKLEEIKTELEQVKDYYNRLLNEYNIPKNYKDPDWDCLKCHDTGRIYQQGKYIICECNKEKHYQKRQRLGNLPVQLQKAHFKSANLNYYEVKHKTESGMSYRENAQKIYSQASSFISNFQPGKSQRGMIIEGPIGSGKSFLLGCIANALIKKNIAFKYLVYTDLLQQIRGSYSDESALDEREIMRSVQEIPILLIDDLGTEKPSEFAASILYQIIDYRYREQKPIFVTTNFHLQEMQTRFPGMGERISQRLLEMNRYVELYGNVRRKIVAERQER